MSDLAILFIHLVVTVSRLFGPGGARSVVAESQLVKHQLLILIEIDKKCSVARARQTLSVGAWNSRSLLAYVPWPQQGQLYGVRIFFDVNRCS